MKNSGENSSLNLATAVFKNETAVAEKLGVRIEAEDEYSSSDENIACKLVNESDMWIGYSQEWQLEKFNEEKQIFELCGCVEHIYFLDRYDYFQPSATSNISVSTRYYGEFFTSGRYRLLFGRFSPQDEDILTEFCSFVLYCEFTVK